MRIWDLPGIEMPGFGAPFGRHDNSPDIHVRQVSHFRELAVFVRFMAQNRAPHMEQ